jgi:hypothetical protein
MLIVHIFFVITTIVYWLIWGRKIKNKKAILDYLKPRYNVAFYTIIFCSVVYGVMIFYLMPENIWEENMSIERRSEFDSFPVRIMQVVPLICLFFLTVPITLMRCLKSSIKREKTKDSVCPNCKFNS